MELIKQGDVENVGPNMSNGSLSRTAEPGAPLLPPPKVRNKTSRFKVNRGGAPRPADWTAEDIPSLTIEPPTPVASSVKERRGNLRLEPSRQARSPSPSYLPDTPLTDVERSSPKLPSECLPIVTDTLPSTLISRIPSSQSTTPTAREPKPPAVVDSSSFALPLSMVIDSPSFVPPKGHNPVFPSTIVDSPSFTPPHVVASMPPMIIDSPDFPPPNGVPSTPTYALTNPPAPPMIVSPPPSAGMKNPGPPRVMSSRVVERSPASVSQPRVDAPGKKVSRFAAERW